MLVPDRSDTRPGRRDDRVEGGERADVPLDQRQRLALVAGVHVHLTAAGLLVREDDLVAEPLEQPDGRLPDLREHGVRQAGDEQRDLHVAHPLTTIVPARGPAAIGSTAGTPAGRARAYVGPQRLQIAGDHAGRPGLHHHVPERGGLHRTGEHRPPGQVGGELAEQPVLAAAADDVDRRHRATGEPFPGRDRPRVADGQRVQDAADDLGRLSGTALPGLAAGRAGSGPACRPGR